MCTITARIPFCLMYFILPANALALMNQLLFAAKNADDLNVAINSDAEKASIIMKAQ